MSFQFDPERLRDLWFSPETNAVIAEQLGLSMWQLYLAGKQLDLPSRHDSVRRVWKTVDPTPEEITERAAAIRRGWSDEEHDRRLVGSVAKPWKMPAFVYDGRVTAFKHQPESL